MKESLYSYLNPGILQFMSFPSTGKGEGPILETLQKIAADDFFGAVEVSWIKDDETRKRARQLLDVSQLDVYYSAVPVLLSGNYDLNSFDEEKREAAVTALKGCVDEALEIGAKSISFLSGKNVAGKDRGRAIDLLVDSISQICQYASERDNEFGVVLEVFDYEIDKCCLVGPVDVTREVAERVRAEYNNFGILVDLSHLPLYGLTPAEGLITLKDYLVHIHLGNAVLDEDHPVYGDLHPRFGLPGSVNGVAELIEFLQTLIEMGYLQEGEPRTVSFEVKPLEGEDPEVVIANCKRTLRKAWARL